MGPIPRLPHGAWVDLAARWPRHRSTRAGPALVVERFADPGGIVVLHDTEKDNPATRRTLQAVVPELKRRGYSFVTLSTLLGPG
jgi:hypothetical protein